MENLKKIIATTFVLSLLGGVTCYGMGRSGTLEWPDQTKHIGFPGTDVKLRYNPFNPSVPFIGDGPGMGRGGQIRFPVLKLVPNFNYQPPQLSPEFVALKKDVASLVSTIIYKLENDSTKNQLNFSFSKINNVLNEKEYKEKVIKFALDLYIFKSISNEDLDALLKLLNLKITIGETHEDGDKTVTPISIEPITD